MKNALIITVMICFAFHALSASDKPGSKFSQVGGFAKPTVSWAKQKMQISGDFKMWISNMMISGETAFDNQAVPPDECNSQAGIGCAYPASACVEHLFGAGPWIGAIVDGVRAVSEGYNGSQGYGYFNPNIADTARDRMWTTSEPDTFNNPNTFGYYKTPMSRRDYDDDGDGRTDEDELDGLDNDHDWVRATDDIGADGLPDTLEHGCNGAYDPVTNADPAFDNYDPNAKDLCHTDAFGRNPLKRNKDLYTQNNGLPDHGEPHVDEDYAAFSDQDIYCSATDTFRYPVYPDHKALGIKIWQKSYAWNSSFASPIMFFEYTFVNVGRKQLRDVFVGFFADMDLGPTIGNFYQRNYAAYIDTIRTAFIHNPVDRGSTPLGLTVLKTPRSLDSLRYTFQFPSQGGDFSPPCFSTNDSDLYSCMSCEAFGYTDCIKPNQPSTQLTDTRLMFSFGPFGSADNGEGPFNPGDSLKIVVAFVTGDAVDKGENNLIENAEKALQFYRNNYHKPPIPPSPCLDTTIGFKRVTLRWGNLGGQRCIDPRDVWDDSNRIAGAYPDTSWRRINPPKGEGEKGGRYFEGFRLYRSEDPSGGKKTFTLIKQFDVPDDEYEYNAGIDTFFIDSNLFRGKTYWYSVTSFGIPNLTIFERPVSGGGVIYDSLFTTNPESDIEDNKIMVKLPFSSSDKLGDVLVVPNPYRVDHDYTLENGGWEGQRTKWAEDKRMVKFIHLPRKCTIRVFSLTGDLVTTLEHDVTGEDSEDRGEMDWNILSESNRALASGIYVYTVESEFGRQIGKFVLIR